MIPKPHCAVKKQGSCFRLLIRAGLICCKWFNRDNIYTASIHYLPSNAFISLLVVELGKALDRFFPLLTGRLIQMAVTPK